MSFVMGLSALVLAATVAPPESVPLSRSPALPTRHPGQNGALSAEQSAMAGAAWRYFQNNFQPDTCLYNSVDGYPSTTMWDTASAIGALVAVFEFEWITPADFDQRMSCLLDSLNRMPLYRDEAPNKAYNTITLVQSDYANNPAEIGFSAIDLGRLLTWLSIVKTRYPVHSEAIDRAVLRWSFCNLVDAGGTLYGAATSADGGVDYLQEGRLGYEEYAAAGFERWGFDTAAASDVEPFAKIDIEGVPIAYDSRDPAQYGAHNYVVTEAYLLSGIETNWDQVGDTDPNDLWMSDRVTSASAKRVYRAQVRRWRDTGTLTARTEHHVDGPPYFVYDTIYSDGVEWNTIADTGVPYLHLAAVSTKAALGMAVLFDTKYTDRLVASVYPLIDADKGVHEGYHESDGRRIDALTANTNGIVLETLLYKMQGKLLRPTGLPTLWDRVPNGEYPGQSQCLPRSGHEAPGPVGESGGYRITDDGKDTTH